MTTLTKLFATLFVSIALTSCVNPPKKPVGKIMAINAKPQAGAPYALVFDLETDFDQNLKLKAGHDGARIQISLDELDRHWAMDAATKEELVRYALQWRERYKMLDKQLNECRRGVR